MQSKFVTAYSESYRNFDCEQAHKLLTSAQYFIEQIEAYLFKIAFQNTDKSS
jgi:hypothetical protein